MDSRDSFYQFVGFVAVGMFVAGLLFVIGSLGNDTYVIAEVSNINSWVGVHLRWFMGVASVIVIMSGMVISYTWMMTNDGRLQVIGVVVSFIAGILALSFLVGIAWLGAKTSF